MTNWITGICDIGGARIHYRRTGSGPALLLLHGLTGSGACWTPVARSLAGEFDLVLPDARGHGQSSAPRQGYGYADHASDVVGLIRALGLVAPAVLGHSMGGMTAAVVAHQTGSLISGAILVDPTFLRAEHQREVHASDVVDQHRRMLRCTHEELSAQLRARHPHRSAEMIGLLAAARLQTRTVAFEVLRPPNPDYRQLISEMTMPVVLVIGDATVVTLETARDLQSLNPRVSVEQIRDAGHGLPYDQPDRLAAVVSSFMRSTFPSGFDRRRSRV